MKVTFSAQGLADGRGGLAVYARELLRALAAMPPAPDRPVLELFRAGARPLRGAPEGLPVHHLRLPTRALQRLSVLGGWRIDGWAGRPDVFHSPDAMAPATVAPQVLTVHDLIPFRMRELLPGEPDAPAHAAYRRGMRRCLPRAARVVCVSGAARDDLHRLFPEVDPAIVRTVPYGAPRPPQGFVQPGPVAPARVLFMGRVEARKDLPTAVAAVAGLRRRGIEAVLEVHGAVVGEAGERIRADAEAVAGGGGWLRFMGETPDPWSAYAGAAALIYPSLYEGFGLPPFEAFAAGVPVVAAAAGSLPELLEGAAVLCAVGDARAFTEGLARAIGDPAPLVAAGRERASRYTWEAAAGRLLEVWREIA